MNESGGSSLVQGERTNEGRSKKSSNREASDILKGMAILAVLFNHYLNYFTELDSGGFANVIISIFFFLSGYGIFTSYTKYLDEALACKGIVFFYLQRLSRIFPLFWVALILQMLIFSSSYPASMFLGYEVSGHYWFVSSILQCYLFAPILIIFLKRKGHTAFFTVSIFFVLSVGLSKEYEVLKPFFDFFHIAKSPYLGIYFLHTYLFFLGLYTQRFDFLSVNSNKAARFPKVVKNGIFFLLTAVAFVYLFAEKFIFDLPLLGGLVILLYLCVFAMRNGIETDNNLLLKIANFFGIHSYSIYLFHLSYYFLLDKLELVKEGHASGVFVLVLLFPVFLIFCLALEKISSFVSTRILPAQ